MFLNTMFMNPKLRHFHSADLSDMRRALVEDDDGPDGGSADVVGFEPPWSTPAGEDTQQTPRLRA